MFDYQSDRHCSKTYYITTDINIRLITSQIDTAPKLQVPTLQGLLSLITSQIDTAPKLRIDDQRLERV